MKFYASRVVFFAAGLAVLIGAAASGVQLREGGGQLPGPKNASHVTPVVAKQAPHALAAANATGHHVTVVADSDGTMKLVASASMKKAEASLLLFLTNEMQKPVKDLTFEEYLPACLEHTRQLIRALDKSYTDVQLETVLTDECWLEKEFPHAYEDSFEREQACREFGKKLAAARHMEVHTGQVEGYEGFCFEYYCHKGGDCRKKAEPQRERVKPISGGAPLLLITVIILFGAIILFFIAVCLRKRPAPEHV